MDTKLLNKSPLAAALGAAVIIGGGLAASGSVFAASDLTSGYQNGSGTTVVHFGEEGKCGEGKCGEGKGSEKEGEGKCGEGKCGDDKGGEGKCGEGKCGG